MPRYYFDTYQPDIERWVIAINPEHGNKVYVRRLRFDDPCIKDYDVAGIKVYLDGKEANHVTSFDTDQGWVWRYKQRWNEQEQCNEPYMDPETLEPAKERVTGVVTYEWIV